MNKSRQKLCRQRIYEASNELWIQIQFPRESCLNFLLVYSKARVSENFPWMHPERTPNKKRKPERNSHNQCVTFFFILLFHGNGRNNFMDSLCFAYTFAFVFFSFTFFTFRTKQKQLSYAYSLNLMHLLHAALDKKKINSVSLTFPSFLLIFTRSLFG